MYKSTLTLLTTAVLALSAGCSGDNNTKQVDIAQATTSAELPPGFLDEAPAPPTSTNQILSGGALVLDQTTNDTVLLIDKGNLGAWGKRGEVDVPNDSIGFDMRGKWLVPGRVSDIAAGTLPNLSAWKEGQAANLLVFDADPQLAKLSTDNLYAVVDQGVIEILKPDSDD